MNIDLAILSNKEEKNRDPIIFSLKCNEVYKSAIISEDTIKYVEGRKDLIRGIHISGNPVIIGNFEIYIADDDGEKTFFVKRFNNPSPEAPLPPWIRLR